MKEVKIVMHYLDDDAEDLEHFKDAVNHTGDHIVLHTYTKHEELLKSIDFSGKQNGIILLDINMPRKNGFEILKEIREREEGGQQLPVIIYSTSQNETAINITRDLGANLYVVKPTSISDLRFIVDTISRINWEERNITSQNFLINLQVQ